jgi:hypothetical protein
MTRAEGASPSTLQLVTAHNRQEAWRTLAARSHDIVIWDGRETDPTGQTWIFFVVHVQVDYVGLGWRAPSPHVNSDLQRSASTVFVSNDDVTTVINQLGVTNPIRQ